MNNNQYYIVVAFYYHGSIAHFLQYRRVLNNIFYNNSPRLFKTKETAIKNANKLKHQYKLSLVKVYQINEDTDISSSNFKELDNKEIYKI